MPPPPSPPSASRRGCLWEDDGGAVDTGKQGDDHRTIARRVRCSNGAPQTAPPAPDDRLATARLNEISLRSSRGTALGATTRVGTPRRLATRGAPPRAPQPPAPPNWQFRPDRRSTAATRLRRRRRLSETTAERRLTAGFSVLTPPQPSADGDTRLHQSILGVIGEKPLAGALIATAVAPALLLNHEKTALVADRTRAERLSPAVEGRPSEGRFLAPLIGSSGCHYGRSRDAITVDGLCAAT
uniref:Uncharacterized protein n=1 Tax=Plectus sambesii TaxID=2011161 RepID=A0A914UQI1_9BILA